MSSLATALFEINQLDQYASADSPVHRLDARVKVLVTTIFCITVVSFRPHELSALLPLAIFPIVMAARGNLPYTFIAKKTALVIPFILLVAAYNPLVDRETAIQIGHASISAGWISFFSIVTRSLLAVSTALVLVCVTGFTEICHALERLGLPAAFVRQLHFLYRYIFVLAEEAVRASLARELRSCGARGLGTTSFSSLIGHLLLRTWGRAERIHIAMCARGFSGRFPEHRTAGFTRADFFHFTGWTATFVLIRSVNCSRLTGELLLGILQ